MSIARIATRYAKSLIDLSAERNQLEEVKADMDVLAAAIQNRDLYLLLKSPIVKGDTKKNVLRELFDKSFNQLTKAFLNILIDKGREGYIPEIARSFTGQYQTRKGIVLVRLTAAVPLADDTVELVRKKLVESGVTGQIEISTAVNPDILGGFILEFEDNLFDASLARKLSNLKKGFRDNLYISQILKR